MKTYCMRKFYWMHLVMMESSELPEKRVPPHFARRTEPEDSMGVESSELPEKRVPPRFARRTEPEDSMGVS